MVVFRRGAWTGVLSRPMVVELLKSTSHRRFLHQRDAPLQISAVRKKFWFEAQVASRDADCCAEWGGAPVGVLIGVN